MKNGMWAEKNGSPPIVFTKMETIETGVYFSLKKVKAHSSNKKLCIAYSVSG